MRINDSKVRINDVLTAVAVATGLILVGFDALACTCIAACVALWDIRHSIAVFVIPLAIGCFVFKSSITQIINIAGFVVCGVASGILFRKQAPNRVILAVLCICMVALLYSALAVEAHMNNLSISDVLLKDGSSDILANFTEIDLDALCIASTIFSGIMIGAIVFLGARWVIIALFIMYAKRSRPSTTKLPIRNILPVQMWCLSKNYTIGLITCVVAVLAVNGLKIAGAETITYALLTFFLVPICMQGICASLFIIGTLNRSRISTTIITVLVFMFAFPIGFTVIGLLDQFTRLRARKIAEALANGSLKAKSANEFTQKQNEPTDDKNNTDDNDNTNDD